MGVYFFFFRFCRFCGRYSMKMKSDNMEINNSASNITVLSLLSSMWIKRRAFKFSGCPLRKTFIIAAILLPCHEGLRAASWGWSILK